MKKLYTIYLAAAFSASVFTVQSQCSLSVSASSTSVCAGDTANLTAYGTNANAVTTTATGGNNHRGNMFDITATNSLIVNSFDVSPMGSTTIEIYYRPTSYSGHENSSNGWILLGSAPVVYTGAFVAVAVPVNISIPAGQTYGFYVTSSNTAVSLNYTDGSSEGAPYVNDGNLIFREGVGMEYPFTNGGGIFRPRIWNGVIHYTPLATAPTVTYLWSTTETTSSIHPIVTNTTQYVVQADVTGCATMFATIEVTSNSPAVSAGTDLDVCSGNDVTLAGSGAVSYSWNNGVTDGVSFIPDVTKDYVVTGTDGMGCTGQDTVTVTVFQLPAVNAGADISVCTGDTITLAGSGANSYVWDNGVTDGQSFVPVSTLDYIVEGTDSNGCINRDTIAVAVNTYPVVNAGSDVAVCYGNQVTLSGSGAASYSWNNGVNDGVAFTPSATLDYIVTGTTNGCSDSDTLTVTVTTVNTVVSVAGTTATAALAGATSYQWIDCTSGLPVNGETNQAFTAVVNGSYAVVISDSGCSDTSACQNITVIGIQEADTKVVVSVYPNPCYGLLNVHTGDTIAEEISILDFSGRLINSVKPTEAQTTIDMNMFARGIYLIRISTQGAIHIVKFTKE